MNKDEILTVLGGADKAESILIGLPTSATHYNHITGQQLMRQTPNIWLELIDNDIDMYNRNHINTPVIDEIISVVEIGLAVYEAKYANSVGNKCHLFCTKTATYFEQIVGHGVNSYWTMNINDAFVF